jgi:hypothetical protein
MRLAIALLVHPLGLLKDRLHLLHKSLHFRNRPHVGFRSQI